MLPRFRKEPASSLIHAAHTLFILPSSLSPSLCSCQSSMPTSSSRVNTPSAWCPVAWEKTRQCISSWARPWCTPRRLSPSRDASLSSTTPTVCSLFHTHPPSHLSISFLGQNTLLPSHSSPLSPLVQPAALRRLYFSPWLHFLLPLFVTLSRHGPVSPPRPATLSWLFIRLCSLATFLAQSLSFLFMLSSFFLPPVSPRRPSQGELHAF